MMVDQVTATPTATPAAPVAAPAPADSVGSVEDTQDSDIWADLVNDPEDEGDEDFTLSGEDGKPEPTPVVEAIPEVKPEPVAEPAPLAEAEPAKEPEPTPPETLLDQQPVEVKQLTPEELEQARAKLLGDLEQTYQLTKEDLDTVELNPGSVLPKLAANLHVRVAESVVQNINAMLPQLIAQTVQNLQTQQKSVDTFFTEWKELNKPEYYDTITRVATLYKQAFPDVVQKDRQRFIREVGIQAWTALGLPLDQLLTRSQQVAAASQGVSQPQPASTGGFAPANPGAPAAGSSAIRQALRDNPFVQLAEEFLIDDDD